jgi:hypothetical protein
VTYHLCIQYPGSTEQAYLLSLFWSNYQPVFTSIASPCRFSALWSHLGGDTDTAVISVASEQGVFRVGLSSRMP